ncbi:MAG: hypothetical protein H0W81_08605 [Chloroflexi bacterium]|nr:hypothetical protein [Chloroflexota bacterium]
MSRGAGVVACLALLAACTPALEHPVPHGPSFESDDFRFVAPTGWEVQPSTATASGKDGIVLYLANQALHDGCPTSDSAACRPPIDDGLRRGGILITWVRHSCVANGCDPPAAQLIPIGNRRGVKVPATQGCEGVGATDGSVYYVTVTPQRVDGLFVCARDPSETTRSALVGFLDAIQWRIP